MEELVLEEEVMVPVLEEPMEEASILEEQEEEASFQELEVQQLKDSKLQFKQPIGMDRTFEDSNLQVLRVLDRNVKEQDG